MYELQIYAEGFDQLHAAEDVLAALDLKAAELAHVTEELDQVTLSLDLLKLTVGFPMPPAADQSGAV